MIIKKLSVAASINIGTLSEKRIKMFSELIRPGFPNRDPNAPLPFMAAFNNGAGQVCIITQQQITIGQISTANLKAAEINVPVIQEWFEKIFDADFLALDPEAQFVIDVEGIVGNDFHVGNRAKSTLQINDNSVSGVGLRVMLNDNEIQGDYRVEPFVPDPYYSFHQLQIVTKVPLSINQVSTICDTALERVAELSETIGSRFLSE